MAIVFGSTVATIVSIVLGIWLLKKFRATELVNNAATYTNKYAATKFLELEVEIRKDTLQVMEDLKEIGEVENPIDILNSINNKKR